MPFPGVPDDLFDQFDWHGFDQKAREQQVAFVNTLDDATVNRLGSLIDGYEASKARMERVLAVASGFLGMGIRLVSAVI